VKCDCGHEFGDYRRNWKLSALIFARDTKEKLEEIYPGIKCPWPEFCEVRESYCPGCGHSIIHRVMTELIDEMNLQDKKDTGATIWKILKKPIMFWPVIKYWDKTCSEMLADYIHDKKLIALFLQLMAYTGTSADEVPAMLFTGMWVSYHHVGFCYFEGGSQAVTKALAEVVKENGGEILLNTLATKIVIENLRPALQDNREAARKARELTRKRVFWRTADCRGSSPIVRRAIRTSASCTLWKEILPVVPLNKVATADFRQFYRF
jgi:phytoene dehydrogenase-like protein